MSEPTLTVPRSEEGGGRQEESHGDKIDGKVLQVKPPGLQIVKTRHEALDIRAQDEFPHRGESVAAHQIEVIKCRSREREESHQAEPAGLPKTAPFEDKTGSDYENRQSQGDGPLDEDSQRQPGRGDQHPASAWRPSVYHSEQGQDPDSRSEAQEHVGLDVPSLLDEQITYRQNRRGHESSPGSEDPAGKEINPQHK